MPEQLKEDPNRDKAWIRRDWNRGHILELASCCFRKMWKFYKHLVVCCIKMQKYKTLRFFPGLTESKSTCLGKCGCLELASEESLPAMNPWGYDISARENLRTKWRCLLEEAKPCSVWHNYYPSKVCGPLNPAILCTTWISVSFA